MMAVFENAGWGLHWEVRVIKSKFDSSEVGLV